MLLALLAPAFGNGLTSHQWITLQAIKDLPDGDLKDFVSREDLRPALLNGALFPDGGYAVGDGYGEMAHWEPFQMYFLSWILANEGTDDDKAFLLGMCSHGMGDQTFDSMFMERSRIYDADAGWAAGDSMDEATDVALSAAEGPGEVPETWYPEVFPQLFADQGHEVSADTLTQGTQLAGLAINSVGVWGAIPDTVAAYDAQFPWANAHIVDPATRCSPVCEAKIVAAYWQVVWDRLEGGDGWSQPVIATIPEDGGMAQPIEAGTPESALSIVLARGLIQDSVVPGVVTVADAAGTDVPVDLRLFYGYASHVLLVSPTNGWTAETDYVVTVHPGLMTFDGPAMLDTYTFGFSTSIPEEDSATGGPDQPEDRGGCGCDASGVAPGWLFVIGAIGALRRGRGRGLTTRPITGSDAAISP